MSMFQDLSATSHLNCNLRVQEIGACGSEYLYFPPLMVREVNSMPDSVI